MVHNHSDREAIFQKVGVQYLYAELAFGDWMKCHGSIDSMKKKYKGCLKHNQRSGLGPIRCLYFDEMDAVLDKNHNQSG